MKRIVHQKVLPGEPLDGSGKICIHLFVRDERGPFTEPHVLYPTKAPSGENNGQLEAHPTRGRLACDCKRSVAPVTRGNEVTVTHRTEEPGAVTCPKCKASPEYQRMTKKES